MKLTWTKGLPKEVGEGVRKDFEASAIMRGRLKDIIHDRIRVSHEDGRSKDAYSSPNWAYLQADARGYERALAEILSLIEGTAVEK